MKIRHMLIAGLALVAAIAVGYSATASPGQAPGAQGCRNGQCPACSSGDCGSCTCSACGCCSQGR